MSPPGSVSPKLTRKTVLLLTVVRSIGPSKGMDKRGCRLNPSSVLSTWVSSLSERCVLGSGSGKFTRRPVFCVSSATVNQSLGNGPLAGVLKSKRATNTTVNRRRVFELTFAFTAQNGQQCEAKARTSITEGLEDQREEPLLYNPNKPEDAVMLDEESSRPQFDESGGLRGRPVAAFFSMILPAIVIAANVLALLNKLG